MKTTTTSNGTNRIAVTPPSDVATLPPPAEKPGRKTVCPLTRDQFRQTAEAITITVNGTPVLVPTKEFSTGSFGWYANGKISLLVGGKAVTVQLGLSVTVVGSKELPL